MIAFTIGYEMCYTNILNMLNLAGVPLYAKDRQGLQNIVFAGGVCAFNPEPLADFVDFFSLGEGEESTVAAEEGTTDAPDDQTTAPEETTVDNGEVPAAGCKGVIASASVLAVVAVAAGAVIRKKKED